LITYSLCQGEGRRDTLIHEAQLWAGAADAWCNARRGTKRATTGNRHGRAVQRATPSFVPWQKRDAARPVRYDGGSYGLVGAAIGAMIAGPLERSIRQTRMFRCMVPRGYSRYRVTEDMWKRIYEAEPEQAIATLAAIASGPVPPTPQVTQ
jgi:hypothetical protein